MTVTLGIWVIPALCTFLVPVWALWPRKSERKNGDYDFAFWIPAAFRFASAIILILGLWLIFFIFN